MDNYLLLKMIHIISSVVLTGTGAGIAFFMLMAYRSSNIEALIVVSRLVVKADWIFTAPAVITQFITGILLMNLLNYSFTSIWFYWVISLFILVGICWLPVVAIQYRLRKFAIESAKIGEAHPQLKKLMTIWTSLGIIAFTLIIVIFWLMIFKPFSIFS